MVVKVASGVCPFESVGEGFELPPHAARHVNATNVRMEMDLFIREL